MIFLKRLVIIRVKHKQRQFARNSLWSIKVNCSGWEQDVDEKIIGNSVGFKTAETSHCREPQESKKCCCWCLVLYIWVGLVSSIHIRCVVVKTERANQQIIRGPRGAYHPNITERGNRSGTLPTQKRGNSF